MKNLMLEDEVLQEYYKNIRDISKIDNNILESKIVNCATLNLEKVLELKKEKELEIEQFKKIKSFFKYLLRSNVRRNNIDGLTGELNRLNNEEIYYNDILNNSYEVVENSIEIFNDVKNLLESIILDYKNKETKEVHKEEYSESYNTKLRHEGVWYDKDCSFQITGSYTEVEITPIISFVSYLCPKTQIPEDKVDYVLFSLNAIFPEHNETMELFSRNYVQFKKIDDTVGYSDNVKTIEDSSKRRSYIS